MNKTKKKSHLNLVKILFDALIHNPARIDCVFEHWMDIMYVKAANPVEFIKTMLELLINAKIQVTMTDSGEIGFFSNRSLSLHQEMLNKDEQVILGHILKSGAAYFDSSIRNAKTIYITETKYSQCRDDSEIASCFSPDRLCARFICYMLRTSRMQAFRVTNQFVLMYNSIQAAIYPILRKSMLDTTQTELCVKYGVFVIVNLNWDSQIEYLPKLPPELTS
jgi:hypothetical protein